MVQRLLFTRFFRSLLGVEVFAYGGLGYGTLQEAMIIEQYVPMVQPDLVVLQVGSNDFINNSWELESQSYFNNNASRRPYLEGGRIRYHYPSRFWNPSVLIGYSRAAKWFVEQIAKVNSGLASLGLLHSIESDMRPDFRPLRRSFATTDAIISDLKRRLPVRLVAFASDDWLHDDWRSIFDRHDIPFFDGVAPAIRNLERERGASVRPDTAHWNADGHRVVGLTLAHWLVNYLPR